MSKTIKTIARIALPIAGAVFGGPIGAAVGGAAAGAIGGGGIKGAVLGAATGYLGAGAGAGILGTAAHTLPAGVAGPVSYGSGIMGAVTGGGMRALSGTVSGLASNPSSLLMGLGNQLMTEENSDASLEAAKIQSKSIDKALAQNTAVNKPYTDLGAGAAGRIAGIEADPAGYIANNPLYKGLAEDATRRLMANQAAKGKVGSGGTAAALQEQMLNLGTGLMNNDVSRLQGQVNTGSAAASGVGATNANLTTAQGDVNASGVMGSNNAYQSGYQNQINTLLALQGLQKTPIYAPTLSK